MILPQLIFITLLGTAVAIGQHHFSTLFPDYTLAPFALLGIALSLFLGFRNNACYDRWWEARKQWGQLNVDSRSLSRQVISYIDGQKEGGAQVKQQLVYLIIAFNHVLRHSLRNSEPWKDI